MSSLENVLFCCQYFMYYPNFLNIPVYSGSVKILEVFLHTAIILSGLTFTKDTASFKMAYNECTNKVYK